MEALSDVFNVLNRMAEARVVERWALGGALAALFYAEPVRTYDVDVFVVLHPSSGVLVDLEPIYTWLKQQGFTPDAEHVMIHGVPVQFLPAYNALVVEAVATARVLDYEGVPVRVASPEHQAARGPGALRHRVGGLGLSNDTPTPDPAPSARWRAKAEWHRAQAALPLREKVRILLALQRQDLPLLARHRALRAWERPWEIEP